MSLLLPQRSLGLDTRIGNNVENHQNRNALLVGVTERAAGLRKQYGGAQHRPTKPTSIYNCHGLTFASRRTGISKPKIVRQILKEDEYSKIEYTDVLAGDVVTYLDDQGDIIHSGIVVEARKNEGITILWVLSKWGDAHEVVHRVGDCPYPASVHEYYRLVQ